MGNYLDIAEKIISLLNKRDDINKNKYEINEERYIKGKTYIGYEHEINEKNELSKSTDTLTKEELDQAAEVTTPRPLWQRSDGSCHTCRTTGAWLSIHNVLVCLTCHPPANETLIAYRYGTA